MSVLLPLSEWWRQRFVESDEQKETLQHSSQLNYRIFGASLSSYSSIEKVVIKSGFAWIVRSCATHLLRQIREFLLSLAVTKRLAVTPAEPGTKKSKKDSSTISSLWWY